MNDRQYLVLCLGGAEQLVSRLVYNLLAAPTSIQILPQSVAYESIDCQQFDPNGPIPGSTGVGKLLVSTPASPSAISSIRCVQRVLALLAQADGLSPLLGSPVAAEHCLVDALTGQLTDAWHRAILLYMAFARQTSLDSFKFRVSGLRGGGKHGVTSMSAAALVGGILVNHSETHSRQEFPTPVVDLENYDAEVVVIVYGTSVVAALTLPTHPADLPAPSQTKGKSPAEAMFPFVLQPSREFSLRPSTAAVLLAIALETENSTKRFPNRLLLDTMCGVGTVPIEAAISGTGAIGACLGGDLAGEVVEGEFAAHLHNVRKVSARPVEAAVWDSTSLPLRSGVVDLAIVDAPFGVKCGKWHTLDKLLVPSLREMARVLCPGGRALILTHSTKKFRGWINEEDWDGSATVTRQLNIGGLLITLFILTRSL